ncbi:phage tail-collar fiber domain-containing protein [Enterobacter cloacae]|uniref:phage tail-collar fiber domain-containing protein n=1 Tax=Enterobacter cloacae TaxID=550 RepID=UPI0023B02A2B|nr:phage tail protein [Enterobacter cloacae]MDE7633715.1 phage tail protein [Enterobacter cloacae]HAS1236735.1 phage tail protein [Enterobacter cloacae]HED1596009.1 phage tail protein [Enterobacter cloacae subsp. cloacae]HED2537774.1 phage tail protein [Enterobacter cloacae subsp. cloacae]
MTVKYKTVITKAGAIKLAAATVPNGKKVNFTAMAIGDGGGTLPVPDPNQTKLVNEVWRHALNKISQDNKNKNYVVAELLIPPETGGFWMREMGLYDDTGTLIAVGNMAESYKPELAEGSGRAQTVRMVIMVSDIESVELTIDTSTVMATQDYVDDKLAEHEQSRRHPDATLTAKGFTQLSSATDSASESVAATPKAVKVAYDLAKGKYTAQDATTAQKGIVQLSSSTDSTSESVAATPKAVKAAYDLAKGKYTAQDATTAQKGIVQLSSSTDSTSESVAATPKAVKVINDDLNAVKKMLGTAAAADAATSDTDTTPKRLVPVGWMGLGAVSGVSFTDANQPNYNCYFRMNAQGLHGPVAGAPANIHQFQYDANAGQQIGYRAGVVNAAMYHRSKVNAAWGSWLQVFDTEHPPTPEQVGAFPNSGSLLSSIFDIKSSNLHAALGSGAQDATAGMPENSGNTRFAVLATLVYTGQFWVTLISRDQNYTGLVNTTQKTVTWTQVYNTANKPAASDVDAVSASDGGAFKKEVSFQAGLNVRSSTGIYAGNDAAGFVSNNMMLKSWYGIGFYCTLAGGEGLTGYINTRNGQLEMKGQIIPGNYSNFDGRYYTKTLADERFQPKGSYTPAGQAYTKAESDGRYQKINTASKAANGWFKDTNTGLIIQWGSGSTLNSAFSLPVAFPNACLSTQITDRGNGRKAFSGMASQTTLTVWGDASNPTYSWLAVGY